jgi:pimeloyl-ACP methyl ester carboxylesterase
MHGLLTLRDGRSLQWRDNGVESDSALILHHGTTISLDIWQSWFEEAASVNVRAIGMNRPGIGESTPHHGRTIHDDATDAAELIEHLALKNFVSIGWSGGGARALGTGLLEACRAIHTIAGISPIDLTDESTITWMDSDRRIKMEGFLSHFDAILEDRRTAYEADLQITPEELLKFIQSLPNYGLFEIDYNKFADELFTSIGPTLVNGPKTDSEDYCANISPWGFSLNQISVPVTIWHGEEDDDVLFGRGQYLHSQLPNSEMIAFPDQGHVTIFLEKRREILASAINSLKTLSKEDL